MEAREKASAALVEDYGVTEFELKSCLMAIKDRLLTYALPSIPPVASPHLTSLGATWQVQPDSQRRLPPH